jgi:ribokinase
MSKRSPVDAPDRSPALRRGPVIAIVGSANVDVVAYVPRVPGPGETVIGSRFTIAFGGKGANQAVMAARLGARVWMLARVGDDAYGTMTIADLEAEGVEASLVRRVPGATGVASIWVEPDGTNRIIVILGANRAWEAAGAVEAVESIADLAVVIGQLEIPQAATAAAFATARARGAMTILNPAPAAAILPALIEATDWLIPNEPEFEALARMTGAMPDTLDGRLPWYAARTGVRLVVTLGADGAVLVGRDGSLAHVPVAAESIAAAVDTTGAGDAFVGSFAHGLATSLGELGAVERAVLLASDSVTRRGARASFPGGGPVGPIGLETSS